MNYLEQEWFNYWVREFDHVMERMAIAEKQKKIDEGYKQMLEEQFQYCRKMVIKYRGEEND